MSYTVRRKPDGPARWNGVGTGLTWTNEGHDKAREWIAQNMSDSLVCNDYITFIFNNKDAAMRFKLVWG